MIYVMWVYILYHESSVIIRHTTMKFLEVAFDFSTSCRLTDSALDVVPKHCRRMGMITQITDTLMNRRLIVSGWSLKHKIKNERKKNKECKWISRKWKWDFFQLSTDHQYTYSIESFCHFVIIGSSFKAWKRFWHIHSSFSPTPPTKKKKKKKKKKKNNIWLFISTKMCQHTLKYD